MHSYWACSKGVDMEWAGQCPWPIPHSSLYLHPLLVICDDFKSPVPSPLPKHTTSNRTCQSWWPSKTKEVIPVQKQFWGAEFGILRDGCGMLWALSTKAECDMEASPYPPPVRSCVSVPDADAYLKFLKEAFGHLDFYRLVLASRCFFTVAIVNGSCKLYAKGQIWHEMGKVWIWCMIICAGPCIHSCHSQNMFRVHLNA